MKFANCLSVLLSFAGCAFGAAIARDETAAEDIRAIYLFKDVMVSDTTALQTSGFNTVLMFGVGFLENGDIMYYSNTAGSSDVLVASNGAYVGGTALAQKVLSLKSAPGTGINRVEITSNSIHLKELMASPGPGSDTRLYRNLAALKEAWNLDGYNNNDEAIYDLASTVTFAKMVGEIGLHFTIVPYTRASFWASVKSQVGDLLDRVYLQCYDGGAGNNPYSWESTLGIKIVPLIWVTNDSKPVYGTTPAQARTRFAGWEAQSSLAGGGYWNDYDIEKMGLSYTEYGQVLKDLFP
ncbi:hypothetical protein V2G26_007861 [Clonostachys chloroleuca]